MATPPRSRVLPAGNLIVGYCNWNQCGDDSIVRAVQEGVNVVIWFAINLDYDPATGLPHITNGPDWACVADTVQKINALGLATTHLIRCRRKPIVHCVPFVCAGSHTFSNADAVAQCGGLEQPAPGHHPLPGRVLRPLAPVEHPDCRRPGQR